MRRCCTEVSLIRRAAKPHQNVKILLQNWLFPVLSLRESCQAAFADDLLASEHARLLFFFFFPAVQLDLTCSMATY